MIEDNQPLDENEEESSTQVEERESEKATEDLDDLFADDSQDDAEEEKPVSREEFNRLMKGVQKLATEKGREAKSEPKEKIETKDSLSSSSVLKNLYMKANPEAQEVWEEVEKEAKLLAKDPFELYEASSYFKGEAKARIEAKKVEQESRKKIEKPSSDTGSSKVDILKVKSEDVASLKPSEKLAWMKAQAEKERNRID